jgi:hypothetical protein
VDAPRFIAQLCSRYRVSLDFGRRLQPLVEMAAKAEPRKQRLLLEMVERSFAEEGRRLARERESGPGSDWRALLGVARVLHGWNPPSWFDWSEDQHRPPGLSF